MQSVGEILLNYDDDKDVPMYGFGGVPKNGKEVSHCFAMNNNEENPEVHEMEGIMQCYDKCV